MSTAPPPEVTVVIPTHNRAHLVGRAITSALAQTLADFEVIVVDDGSTDETAEVVRSLADPRLRLVQLSRKAGDCRARNAGIQGALGELVAFLDDDDEWLPQKLARQVARLRAEPDPLATVVYCRCVRHDDATGRSGPVPGPVYEGDVFERLLLGWGPVTSSAVMVRRPALLRAGGFDAAFLTAGDHDLWLRLAQASNHFVAVDELLVVKHENFGPQLWTDPDARARDFATGTRRWGPVIASRLGRAAYRQWKVGGSAGIQWAHFMRVRHAVASGHRRAAWRHCLAMCRWLPWSRRYLIYGVALAILGPDGYRTLSRARATRNRRVRSR